MRQTLLVIVPVVAVGLYLIDQYEFEARYANLIWSQANTAGLRYQNELKGWWRSHGVG